MSIPVHARPTLLISISEDLLITKIRVAGRMLCYDSDSSLIILVDKNKGILVDVSACVDAHSTWMGTRFAKLMVEGYLERPIENLSIPELPAFTSDLLRVETKIFLRAVIVAEKEDMDLGLWNAKVQQHFGI